MEMNTRIQVEHTVTELVTGLDLVREQILIAQGEPISVRQEDVSLRGHAIECRINAEDVGKGFLPAPGLITAYEEPSGPGVRVDSGVRAGDEISGLYDPMIAKLIVHDTNRETARRRMLRALAEFRIEGPPTLLGFHAALLSEPCFIAGETCHGLVESEELAQRAEEMTESFSHRTTTIVGGPDGMQTRERVVAVEVDGRSFDVRLHTTEPPWAALGRRRRERSAAGGAAGSGAVTSPMQGTVLKILVAEGDTVTAGQVICVVEAMKMENEIAAPRDGIVTDLGVSAGQAIASGQLICVVATPDERSGARCRGARSPARRRGDAHGGQPEPAAAERPVPPVSRHRRTGDDRRARCGTASRRTRGAARRDENLTPDAAADRLVQLLDGEFRQGVLQSTDADWQVLAGGTGARPRSCAGRRPVRR